MKRLALAAGLFLAASAAAHDFWISPSSFQPAVSSSVQARLFVGTHFQGEPVPRYAPWIQRFALLGPGIDIPMFGRDGSDPAGAGLIAGPGLYFITYQSTGSPLELDPAKFEEYLRAEGLEKILELRAARGESQKPSRELFYRCAKSLLQAGGSGSEGFDRILGLTLEIIPEKNPYTLPPGAALPVRLLYEGKPLQGALFIALDQAAPDKAISIRSDAEGRATFTLPRDGVWLIKAVEMIPARGGKDTDWESFWASLTFRLGPPPPDVQPTSAAPPAPPAPDRRLPVAGGFSVILILLALRRRRARRRA